MVGGDTDHIAATWKSRAWVAALRTRLLTEYGHLHYPLIEPVRTPLVK